MRKFLVALVALLACASSAQAASISVDVTFPYWTGEDPWPGPGDTAVLTITATADAGETDYWAFGALIFTNDVTIQSRQQSALQSFDGAIPWIHGGYQACGGTGTYCVVFNQVYGALTPIPVTNTPLVIATLTLSLSSTFPSLYAYWDDDFQFFGAETPERICIADHECLPPVIPEPETGALLGLGLLTLAAVRRRARA